MIVETAVGTFGRALELGDYCVSILETRVAVTGPSRMLSRRAEERLLEAMESEEGSRLLAAAIQCGGRPDHEATIRLAARLELPDPRLPPPRVTAESPDPDADADAIRAYRLPALCSRWIDELQGMCAAIVSDGRVDDAEISLIDSWMARSSEAAGMWPVSELRDILEEIRNDGVITAEERARLLSFLQTIAADPQSRAVPAETIFEAAPVIAFPGRNFLFTGRLDFCTRKEAWGHVDALGGRATDSPSRRIDYLIVGDLGNETWKHSRYGRKIQAVMEWKRKGAAITIAREVTFIAALRREGVLH